jgi:hypothetical protein
MRARPMYWRTRHGGSGARTARASAASTPARSGGIVVFACLVVMFAISGVAYAGATPDPAPTTGGGAAAGPAPDPAPQAASQPRTVSSSQSTSEASAPPPVITTSALARQPSAGGSAPATGTSVAGVPIPRGSVLGVTVVRSGRATPSTRTQIRHREKARGLKSGQFLRGSAVSLTTIAERVAATLGKRNPLDAFAGATSPSTPARHDGLLLLLAAGALLVLMLGSGLLLRLLTRMDPGAWAR